MENKFSVIKDNIKIADETLELSNSVRIGQIEELTRLFVDEALSFDLTADTFKRVFNSNLMSAEFLAFCNNLQKIGSLKRNEASLNKSSFKTVSFLDNDYSKIALEHFCNKLDLSGESETNFNSVCEAVYSGRCDCAILPLFNSKDGLIISLYKLLQKYDLKIIASTKVLMNDGDTETEFVLISRKSYFDADSVKLRIMLSITHPYDNTVPCFLTAISSLKITLKSINTLPLEYTDERCESVITYDVSTDCCNAMTCFLHSALPEANVVGIYSYC